MSNPANDISRRNFVKAFGGCAALTSTSLLSTLVNLKAVNAAVADQGDTSGYKALVCLFLFGGNDSFNMLTPYEQSEYDTYALSRDELALDRGTLLPIVDPNSTKQYGVHPSMQDVQTLYNAGNLAFVSNVGSLIDPVVDRADYRSGTKSLPLGLFSHADLIRHWQTAVPGSRSQVTGWAGRMADLLTSSANTHPSISMNIALNSNNVFQTGTDVVPYIIRSNGATALSGYNPANSPASQNGIYTRITDDIMTATYSDLLEKSYGSVQKGSIDAAIDFNNAIGNFNLSTTFDQTNPLAKQLEVVAKAIGAQGLIGQSRQIFFVNLGGWDNHDELLNNQIQKLGWVSQALGSFYQALDADLGAANDVVTFTASDFARTLSSNGNGTDHAWGGNHMVMGGSVTGGKVYGTYPDSLAIKTSYSGSDTSNPLDLGRGRLIPTTAVDQYAAEIAEWFGVPNNAVMEDILPNIRNFYSAGASTPPLGFLL